MERGNESIVALCEQNSDQLSEALRPFSEEIRLSARQNFTSAGDELKSVYYIKEGRVKLFIYNEDGSVKVLYCLAAGWFFGEIPCLLEVPTGLSSQAEEPSVLYRISQETFMTLLEENRLFRTKAFLCLSKKLLMLRHEIENITFNSCKDRIRRLLCTLADTSRLVDNGWHNLLVDHTHAEIGEIVGGTRVTISRLLTELCKENCIRMVNRRIQVSAEQCGEAHGES